MIAYLSGKLAKTNDASIIVETNGLGYELFIPTRYSAHLPNIGEFVTFHTYYHVREDAHTLYGFWLEEEKELFKLLLSVTGIGPKSAMSILSGISPAEFKSSILVEDEKYISGIPGIGKKTASRLILELKDKIQKLKFEQLASDSQARKGREDLMRDALMALVSLGFSRQQAQAAVEKVVKESTDESNLETLIKASIRNMQR
jgi:Holliday junction DNA helicase RuvA